jgi:uncharacterized repeat protein (TIGR01451 family)
MADGKFFTRSLSFELLLAVALAASVLPVLAGAVQAQTETGINVTQTVSPDPATVGEPFTFTITTANDSATQHVGLKNFLPPEATIVSATPSQGSCHISDLNDVLCPLGEVPSGGSATVTVVVTPTAPRPITSLAHGGGESVSIDSTTVTVNPAPESVDEATDRAAPAV